MDLGRERVNAYNNWYTFERADLFYPFKQLS